MIRQADGGTTSETGNNSWGASSDSKSEVTLDQANNNATTATTKNNSNKTTTGTSNNSNTDSYLNKTARSAAQGITRTPDEQGGPVSLDDGSGQVGYMRGEGQKRDKKDGMLFASGMMGVKRQTLGGLRYCIPTKAGLYW